MVLNPRFSKIKRFRLRLRSFAESFASLKVPFPTSCISVFNPEVGEGVVVLCPKVLFYIVWYLCHTKPDNCTLLQTFNRISQ